jgi:aminoglycoside phosphotransferase (APT) family kinase protein
MSDLTLPAFPDGLTPAWMTAALRRLQLIEESESVSAVERQQVGEGVGMMSELSRLVLTYDGAASGAPASFIAKYPSQNPTNREVAMSFNLYEREVRYFAELEPRTSAVSPRAFMAQIQGDNFLLLLEDLSDYRTGDQIEGADLADSAAAVAELAKLHAAFWNNVDDIDWIPHICNSYHADNMQAGTAGGWSNMVEVFGDFLSDEVAALQPQFSANLPQLQQDMDSAPITLIHGDYRMENFLFGTRPEHHELAIIDWQGPLLGKGMVDVALVLGQSTRIEVRRAHERGLVEQYATDLRNLGVAYSNEQAWQDYLAAMLYNWCYVAVVSGTLDASNQRAFAWMSQMVARQVAATEDHDLLSRLS